MALFLWVPVSLLVFSRARPHRAVASLLVAAAILLPERQVIDLKVIPDIDKQTIASTWVFIPALIWCGKRLKRARLGAVPKLLFGLMFIGDIGKALTNADAIAFAPGIETHTALTFVMEDFLRYYVTIFLGMAMFGERLAVVDLLRTFAIAGACYVPLVALELRVSPQLHSWVYGYMQHDWDQVLREGGYRPMVFMEHGLAVALFLVTCSLCALGLTRAKVPIGRYPAWPIATALCVTAAINPSMGARLFLVALAPLVLWTSPKTQVRVAALMGAIVLLYPILRASDLIPAREIVAWLGQYSPERAGSIDFRFINEDLVLERALKRPLFGWGGFQRKFIYNRETEKFNVIDGAWIIAYAESGALGFISRYGLLTWPLWQAVRRLKRVAEPVDRRLIAALALVLAMNVADLLPNGMFTYFPGLLAGALLGAVNGLSASATRANQSMRPMGSYPPPPVSRAGYGQH